MRVINVEDDVIKHSDICKVLRGIGITEIDWARSLEEALNMISNGLSHDEEKYDLIISDMWYPEENGGKDIEAGDLLIEEVAKNGWNIPIVICSSVNYRIMEILGTVYYSDNSDWELDLIQLIGKIK